MANRYNRYPERERSRRERGYDDERDPRRLSAPYRNRSRSFRQSDRDEGYFGGSRRYGSGYSPGHRSTEFDRSYYSESDTPDRGPLDYPRSTYGPGGGADYRQTRRGRTSVSGLPGRGNFSRDFEYARYEGAYPRDERGYFSDDYRSPEERSWWDKTTDEVASWFGDEEAERRREVDELRERGFRGKGPKGYIRSDQRIQEDISDRLTDADFLDASEIEVNVKSGDVTLTGTVTTRFGKRLAEDLSEEVSGVKNVENRLRVDTPQTKGRSATA